MLPHWVEYPDMHASSIQIPFDKYFQVEPLAKYTSVLLMNDFMDRVATQVWPAGKRAVFCYSPRSSSGPSTCDAKQGNPFGPYWDKFSIDFDSNLFYGPLGYNPHPNLKQEWDAKYPPSAYPVLAFTGAPGAFPVIKENVDLQVHLHWSDEIEAKATKFLMNHNKKKEFLIAVHLRNGVDFVSACRGGLSRQSARSLCLFSRRNAPVSTSVGATGTISSRQLNASAMALNTACPTATSATRPMMPSSNRSGFDPFELESTTLIHFALQLSDAIRRYNAKHVYVASDDNYMLAKFQSRHPAVNFFKYEANSPHVDLCILGMNISVSAGIAPLSLIKTFVRCQGKADHAILNCISSFSAFAKRERDASNRTSEFWSFRPDKRDEL